MLALAAAWPAAAQTAPPAAPADPAPQVEPVTEAQVRELKADGLIARQAEIGEGLLLMDRQLRQAQMAQQLVSLFGPETLIEVAPGEFRDFSATPLGMREQIARLQLELQLLELSGEVQRARQDNRGSGGFLSGIITRPLPPGIAPAPAAAETDAGTGLTPAPEPAPQPLAVSTEDFPLEVRQLHGSAGRYSALLRIDGEDLLVSEGDRLENGIAVLSIDARQVVVDLPGSGLRSLATPDRGW
jgi:hypothetical protein